MIKEKIYYYLSIETLSPLAIGNGSNDLTDHDLVRDNNGDVFIPATSLAGVFVHSLTEEESKVILKEKVLSKDKESRKILSPMFVSDATLKEGTTYTTSIRNGVILTEDKVTEDGAKYDIEIVEKGLKLDFRIELTVREDDDSLVMKEIINKIISNLNKGNIVLGLKSKRGFGKVKVVESYIKEFASSDLDKLLEFDKYNSSEYDNYEIKEVTDTKYDLIEVSLKQLGGISIKSYSAKAFDVDFEHIKSNGVPVIPGMSYGGFIRKQVEYYNKLLGKDDNYTNNWFGYVEKGSKVSISSKIIINESVINNSKEITITRNKIDRFSGGSADSALFSERVQFNGETDLTIRVPKYIRVDEKQISNKYILGLLALTIKDIDNGFIALGGQTSIGRGLFKVMKVKMNDKEVDLDNLINEMNMEAENE